MVNYFEFMEISCNIMLGKSFFFFFLTFSLFRATPMPYGGSQARGLMGAVAASLCQSHSNAGSKPRLSPTPEHTATLNPQPTEQGQGSNPRPHGS